MFHYSFTPLLESAQNGQINNVTHNSLLHSAGDDCASCVGVYFWIWTILGLCFGKYHQFFVSTTPSGSAVPHTHTHTEMIHLGYAVKCVSTNRQKRWDMFCELKLKDGRRPEKSKRLHCDDVSSQHLHQEDDLCCVTWHSRHGSDRDRWKTRRSVCLHKCFDIRVSCEQLKAFLSAG